MDPWTLLFLLSSSIMIPSTSQLYFNFPSFNQSTQGFTLQGNSIKQQNGIDLTVNRLDSSIDNSIGRMVYQDPVLLWDSEQVTDFTTHFSFIIKALDNSSFGDGLAFFLSPDSSVIPPDSTGGGLALFSNNPSNTTNTVSVVAVEFDTYQNAWDPSPNHVGINVNTIISNVTKEWESSIKDGRVANAWISYIASTKNLSVFLTYAGNPKFSGNSTLSYIVDLKEFLPETITIGFSAATGQKTELHQILSWKFNSTLEARMKTKSAIGLVVGLVVGIGMIMAISIAVWFAFRAKRRTGNEDEEIIDGWIDEEFEKSGRGPKRIPYGELVIATNNFAEDGKVGEGGFGTVYKGFLIDSNLDVAIKRVSQGSKQGKKEYISEVKVISRLRHRNLVQLVGWCHEHGEFFLIYELMHNGSLDVYLYGKKRSLDWSERYKIALGLASALLYLHQEWEQCVVHRDVKPSNVMLDSRFNAKLGDFGLARFVDHDQGSQTTILAGTMGYLAPECVTIGKASKESDVYSFGVVALEVACGRRPVEPNETLERARLVEWVWGLYGRRAMLEAVDSRLNMNFDEQQMERLMVVGLWCAHPDMNLRPSIRQAIGVLNFESPLPELPPQMPVPMYFAPPLDACRFSYASSQLGRSSGLGTGSSSSFPAASTSSVVSNSLSSSASLMQSYKADV